MSADAEKFGLNLNGGDGDINTLSEKWEALAMVPANDPVYPNDYFLFVGNDNDFLSGTGKHMDAAGVIQSYDGGLENDSVILAYRVRAAAATPATIVSAGDTTQTSSVLWAHSYHIGSLTFEHSTDPTFATGVVSSTVSVTDPAQPVKALIIGLLPNTTYHYRANSLRRPCHRPIQNCRFPHDQCRPPVRCQRRPARRTVSLPLHQKRRCQKPRVLPPARR